jgi:predicted acetyltransferase
VGIDIRAVKTDDELEAFVRTDLRGFGASFREDSIERARRFLELDRTRAAFDTDDGAIVGCSGALSWSITVPGGAAVPASAVTWVSVRSTHRRRGLLRSMMTSLLDDAVDRGEPLAILYASESVIYGRFGYGTATWAASMEIERAHAALAGDVSAPGRMALLERDEAEPVCRAVFDEYRLSAVGEVTRSDAWWDDRFADHEWQRHGASNLFYVVHERSPGVWDGYAMYRIHERWDGSPASTLEVVEVVALSDDTRRALLALLLDVDLVSLVRFPGAPVDEPLRWSLADPRRLRTTAVHDAIWVRVLDVERALAARTYAVDGRLVLQVDDAFRPAAGGVFDLEGGPAGATCRRVEGGTARRDPDVVLSASALGSLSLGGVGAGPLIAGGRARVRDDATAALVTSMFRTDRAPFSFTDF